MFRCAGKVVFLLIASCAMAYAAKLPNAFNGYVTGVTSQNQFEIGSRQVVVNAQTQRLSMQSGQGADTYVAPTVRVGSLLHVEGRFNKRTKEFIAHSISFLPQPDWGGKPNDKIEDIGLIEERPELHREGNGAVGTLWVEGYPLKVTPQTKLVLEDGKDIPVDQIHTNMWAVFQGKWLPDHSIEAVSIHFWPNTISQDEVKFRDKSEPKVQAPDYSSRTPGKLKFRGSWDLSILPDSVIQRYVTRVGEGLIPQYQKDLPAPDPSKINFRFYVVEKPSRWKEVLADASATPGGIIYIPDNVLAVLDNEAQLAALLSNCIAGTLDKQVYVHRQRLKAQNIVGLASDFAGLYGLPIGIGNSISAQRLELQMNERASRIGLRYMLHAGYDIRQAPFAWSVAANQKVKNPWPSGAMPSALAQNVMGDLYFQYPSTDYSQLKTDREAYQKMLVELRAAVSKLPKPTNH